MSFKWYFDKNKKFLCWCWGSTVKTGCLLRIKQTYLIPKQTEVVPHSQPTASRRTVCKFHLDPQYNIFHWGSTVLGVSTLYIAQDLQIKLFCHALFLWWLYSVFRGFIWFIYPYCPSCFADTGPSGSKATLRDMDKGKCIRPQQSKSMCIILGIYCGRGWRIMKSTFFNGGNRMGKLKAKFRLAQQIGSGDNKPSKYPLNWA